MKMIFIYGSPAVGKLTVAKEIAKLTDFKLFHNHLTVDLVKSLFPFRSKNFMKLLEKLRLDIIEHIAKEDIANIIFTFCYAPSEDKEFVNNIYNIIKKYNGQIYFVHLYSNKDELIKRVNSESRKEYKKINEETVLLKDLQTYDYYTKIDFVESLEIDNSYVSAKETAMKIIKHFNLKEEKNETNTRL
ncbi:MAG: AAA family ATPase [Candidatus Micrarchaeia archaeon]|jgi:gluconate kinase